MLGGTSVRKCPEMGGGVLVIGVIWLGLSGWRGGSTDVERGEASRVDQAARVGHGGC
jgi:hypothetical protein